ncbi:MAG: exopolysaccharide transport family protein [Hyphomicrobiales bacterium]
MSLYTENQNQDTEIDVGSLMLVLWRKKGWIIFWTLVGLVLAIAFLFVVDPVFKTDARLLIEKRETVFTRPNDEQNIAASQDFDVLTVASQVEVLQSRSILGEVAKKLKLDENPEFNSLLNGGENPISSFLSLLGLGSDSLNDTRERRVLSKLADKLSVYPVGDSRVVSVEVITQDPVLSADIANAISTEYIQTQRLDGGNRAKDASQFLEKEIDDLRAKVSVAEQEVEEFRSSADLIGADDDSTITKQQLSETLTLMSDVSAQRAEAEAKSDQIRRLIRSGAALDISSDVQGSPLIQRLREQQVTLRARIVDLQTSLLPSHPQVQAARSQLSDLEREIASQALLIARALEGDAEVAKVRQQELEEEVARLKVATGRANEQEIKLRALERDARSQRELLETYLNRFRESTARQNSDLLPVNARVISKASVPVKTHFPKTVPTLAVAGFAGGFLASLFVLMGELLSGRGITAGTNRPYRDEERIDHEILADADKKDANNKSYGDDDHANNAPLAATLSERASRHQASQGVADEPAAMIASETQIETQSDLDVPIAQETHSAPEMSSSERIASRLKHSNKVDLASDTPEAMPLNEDQSETSVEPTHLTMKTAHKSKETDLYNFEDAISAIDRYQLEQIVVLPVFNEFSCADMALELARSIGKHDKRVVFVDTTNVDFDDEPPLAGITDVMAGQVPLNEVVFSDPASSVDLIAKGTMKLDSDDLNLQHLEDILDVLLQNYDVTVLHMEEGISSAYFEDMKNRSDMLLFAVGVPLSRRHIADLLSKQIGDVPAHSMFVYFDDKDIVSAA